MYQASSGGIDDSYSYMKMKRYPSRKLHSVLLLSVANYMDRKE